MVTAPAVTSLTSVVSETSRSIAIVTMLKTQLFRLYVRNVPHKSAIMYTYIYMYIYIYVERERDVCVDI